MQAGDLRDRVSFGQLADAPGEGGNYRTGPFAPAFTLWANIRPLNGGEEVMAGRLTGFRTVLITVRSLLTTRKITTEWCARNERDGETFNILEVKDPDSRRQWLEILCRSGVAGGGVPGEQAS
jgi:SPP1 family predicted phage head-tail adaptor